MVEIKLTEEQLQRMVIILGVAPYKDVADIIDEIKKQVNQQMNNVE